MYMYKCLDVQNVHAYACSLTCATDTCTCAVYMHMPVGFCCRAEARLRGRELPLGTVVAVTIPRGREEAAEEREEDRGKRSEERRVGKEWRSRW